MRIYTMGFSQKSAKRFFELLRDNEVDCLVDVRLNNVSQLSGFAKSADLQYFLKEILNIQYLHNVLYAPTKDILDSYRAKKIDWSAYEEKYNSLLHSRQIDKVFFECTKNYKNICLLCSEPTAEKCHRRLMAEYLKEKSPSIEIRHI